MSQFDRSLDAGAEDEAEVRRGGGGAEARRGGTLRRLTSSADGPGCGALLSSSSPSRPERPLLLKARRPAPPSPRQPHVPVMQAAALWDTGCKQSHLPLSLPRHATRAVTPRTLPQAHDPRSLLRGFLRSDNPLTPPNWCAR